MRPFKKAFYDLTDSYKSLPYMDEEVFIEKGNKRYKIILEIKEHHRDNEKATHTTIESLLEYMIKNKDIDWKRCDNPHSNPPLLRFSNLFDNNFKQCSISLYDCANSKLKLSPNQIIARVKKLQYNKEKVRQEDDGCVIPPDGFDQHSPPDFFAN